MTTRFCIWIPTLLCLLSTPSLGEEDSSRIYERRVLPLLRSPAGSSCKECHFSGIELGDFFGDNEADTFANLRAGGWIDVDKPGESKLLAFVSRSTENPSAAMQSVRKKEQAAITAWLTAAIARPQLINHKSKSDIGIELDSKLIRHLRSDHVLSRFTDNIWSEMGRCINCHSPERNERHVKEHGEQMSWIVPHDPQATLAYLRDNGLIDLDDPGDSELRTKPTELVEHGGGPKFPVGSASDKRFLRFLRDYAKVVRGGYTAGKQLPQPNPERVHATENHLRLIHVPESWIGKLVRVDLYSKTDAGWGKNRIATADSTVSDKSQWQNTMQTVSAPNETPAAKLSGGLYLARVFVDQSDRLKKDPDATLSQADFVGTIEFEGPWKLGWQEPKIVGVGDRFKDHLDRGR